MQLDGLKILLVEDDPGKRRVAQRMLEGLGALVSAVANGSRALERVGTEHFDVLLIDMDMRASGLDAVRRAAVAPPDGPTVIALSSEAPASCAGLEAAGVAGVVSRRASPDRVARDIRRLMKAAGTDATPASGAPDPQPAPVDPSIYAALVQAFDGPALGDFLATVEEDVAVSDGDLGAAAAADDMGGVRAATHVLVAVAGAVGAVALQGLAERLNRAAGAGDGTQVARLAVAAHAEAARLRAFLDAERERAGR